MRMPGRRQNLQSTAWLTLLVGIGTIIYVGTSNPYVAACGQVVTGFAFGLFEPLVALLAQRLAPIDSVGRVVGVLRVCQRLSGVLPLLAAPWLADRFGVQPVLVGAGVTVCAMGALFSFVIVPRVEGRAHRG
jgi:predicted MFS family arabinose efflux permease